MPKPRPTPQQQLVMQIARLFPEAVFYQETSEKVVALTIDDMPTPGEADEASSQLILDAIAAHNQSVNLLQNINSSHVPGERPGPPEQLSLSPAAAVVSPRARALQQSHAARFATDAGLCAPVCARFHAASRYFQGD